ncbi:MAG: T9SS type A sorting domain-containing protein [Saprospiraceae bacterium]
MSLRFSCILLLFLIIRTVVAAQTGCPGCTIDLPNNLPSDTVFLQDAEIGFKNRSYDFNISFRLPKSTTPVSVLDPSVPGGLPIDEIKINGLSNVPLGLNWEINQTLFNPSNQTDGCLRICGTPEVTGYFLVEVNLTASVFGIQQESAFTFPLEILPELPAGDPLVLFNNIGCDSLNVVFVNNIQSNGMAGFSYFWEFGNGLTSMEENPGPMIFKDTVEYIVRFQAIIDTSSYQFNALRVLEVGCSDFAFPPFISGNPDLYFVLKDELGNRVYTSETKSDASVPTSFSLDFELLDTAYTIEVWDDDTGLGGSDDFCGEVALKRENVDTLRNGNLTVIPVIFHPVLEINDFDTISVFKSPDPVPFFPNALQLNCQDSFYLTTSGIFVDWFFESNFIENSDSLLVELPGSYYNVFTNSSTGCFARSDSINVLAESYPPTPFFINDNNELVYTDTSGILPSWHFQWFLNGDILPDETGLSVCARSSGTYGLMITDTISGCSSFFDSNIAWNPNVDCFSSTRNLITYEALSFYPNPSSNIIRIRNGSFQLTNQVAIFNVEGILVKFLIDFKQEEDIDVSKLAPGRYFVRLVDSNSISFGSFLKI